MILCNYLSVLFIKCIKIDFIHENMHEIYRRTVVELCKKEK